MSKREAVLSITRQILAAEAEAQAIANKITALNGQLDAVLSDPQQEGDWLHGETPGLAALAVAHLSGQPAKSIKDRIVELVEGSDRAWTSEEIAKELDESLETVTSLISRLVNKYQLLSRPSPRTVAKKGWVSPVA